jgi:hypothetical protein
MKKFVLWIVVAVIIGGALGGTFIGGIALGKSQEHAAAQSGIQNQVANRFGQGYIPGANNEPGIPAGENQPGFMRRGTVGTVVSIDGNKITLKTVQGTEQIVMVNSDTTVIKTVAGAITDIAAGSTIQVTGETQTDGAIGATSISITPGGFITGGPMQSISTPTSP